MANTSRSARLIVLQLLYEIYIFASWHLFPHTSKHIYSVFKHAPSSVHAEYLLARQADAEGTVKPGSILLTRILRYPICNQAVLEALFRLPHCPSMHSDTSGAVELPRRLFRPLSSRSTRPWTTEDQPLPFLRYLYNNSRMPHPNANHGEGYALTRSVASGFIPLVRFLLDQGASPACKGGIAVHAAIRRKNLSLVKLLIEPGSDPAPTETGELDERSGARDSKRRRRTDRKIEGVAHEARRATKRRKLEDRVPVDQNMLRTAVACDARDIVKYFMEEKSCMPDMQTVRMMRH